MPKAEATDVQLRNYIDFVLFLNKKEIRGKIACDDARYYDFLNEHLITHKQLLKAINLCSSLSEFKNCAYVLNRKNKDIPCKDGNMYLTTNGMDIVYNLDTNNPFLPKLEIKKEYKIEPKITEKKIVTKKEEKTWSKVDVFNLLTKEAHMVGRMLGQGYDLLEEIHSKWIYNWIVNPKSFHVMIHQAHRNSYKCFAPDTEILMYDKSIKKIKDIKLGDYVMGWDGTKRMVLEAHSGKSFMYKVQLKGTDESYICNGQHILTMIQTDYNSNKREHFDKYRLSDDRRIIDIPLEVWLLLSNKDDKQHFCHFKVDFDTNNFILYQQKIEKMRKGDFVGIQIEGDGKFLLANNLVVHNSTCLRLAIAIIMILQPTLTVILIRKSEDAVKELIGGVSKILETPLFNKFVEILHPDIMNKNGFKKTTDTALIINTNLNISLSGEPQLRGVGLGSPLTGMHSKMIITDDIVTLVDRESDAERRNTISKYQELVNIISTGKGFEDSVILNIGTPWHEEDAFNIMEKGLPKKSEMHLKYENIPEKEKTDKQREKIRLANMDRGLFVYNCYQTGLMTDEEIKRKKEMLNDDVLFAANYLLSLVSDDEKPFPKINNFGNYSNSFFVSDSCWEVFAAIDCAYGGDDSTSLSIGAIDWDNHTVVVFGKMYKGVAIDKNYMELAEEMYKYNAYTLFLETNADKGLMGEKFRELGFNVNDYHEYGNKHTKIVSTIRPFWREKGENLMPCVQFTQETDEDYLKQIYSYKKGVKHDDAPDNLACLLLRGKFSSLSVRIL